MRTKKLVLNSILVALSAIFSYVEAIIPIPLGIPGIKLGLANVVTVFALYRIGLSSAVLISAVRIIIVSALFANPMMALYSLAGAALSLTAMTILKRAKIFSIIGVSMAGGVFIWICEEKRRICFVQRLSLSMPNSSKQTARTV